MIIRKAIAEDIPQMQEVFAEAKLKMRSSGNLQQWTGGYPLDDQLLDDISRGFSYCGIIYLADGSPRLAYQLMQK